jgi:flagellar motor component MotA
MVSVKDTKIILKSRKLMMPYIIIFIEEVDPEEIREIMLKYIAETEHNEHFIHKLLERLGF